MKVGLIGFQQSGKSCLFRAAALGQAKGDMHAVPVPDERFDAIVKQVQPKKATPATVIFHDHIEPINGAAGQKMFSQKFLDEARKMDCLLHVVRAFESNVAAYHTDVNAMRDLEEVEVEMVVNDLAIIENRLERLKKSLNLKTPGHADHLENELFNRIKPMLEEGTPIRAIELDEDEQKIVKNYQFLSGKQTVIAFNVGEDEAAEASPAIQAKIKELAANGTQAFTVCASIEEEIAQLEEADREEFLTSLGLSKPASHRVILAIYDALGLITFFTAGENDTRAWPLKKGSSALKAAATIHNDIAKGFIRAETVHFADYLEHGSLDAAYKANKMSLEGKEYVIQDGDLLHIRNKS
jgi:GTP-binding protein YchF